MAPTRKTGRTRKDGVYQGSPPPQTTPTAQHQVYRTSSPVRECDRRASGTGVSLSASAVESALGGRIYRGSEGLGSVDSLTGGDEEGLSLGLLRQQLSAVKRIRLEHKRKDAVIAVLRLGVCELSREKQDVVALKHERDGMRVRLLGLEERCRQLETAERDSGHRWSHMEEHWQAQIRDAKERSHAAQEKCQAERDRAEELTVVNGNMEPALAVAEARAKVAVDVAARERTVHAEAELRTANVVESLKTELETELAKARGLGEDKLALEKELVASREEVECLASHVKNLQEVNHVLRNRSSEAELELAQLHVYRPLVERADLIDRRRAEAEEGLRLVEAELAGERASSEAMKRNAAELQTALDRHGARLAKAELEASKALSLERDLLFLTHRLEAAKTDKETATRERWNAENAYRIVTSALEELADLAAEALPRQEKAPPYMTLQASLAATECIHPEGGGGQTFARDGGVNAYGVRGKSSAETAAVVTRLAKLESRLRMRTAGRDDDHPVGGRNGGTGMASCREDRGLGSASWDGGGELRRAVRAVRVLAEAAARLAVDRESRLDEIVHARAESRCLGERVEALQRENRSAAKALEKASACSSASRSALLPRLRDAQMSRLAAEVAAERARSELDDIRDFLGSISETLSCRVEEGFSSNNNGNKSKSKSSPWSDFSVSAKILGTEKPWVAGAAVARWPSSTMLISAVSAGIKGLEASCSTATNTIRDMGSRCRRSERQLEELHHLARDRVAAHSEQLTDLRYRCESEVDTQKQAKKAAQGAAEGALLDLAAAVKKISAFDKEKSSISSRVADINGRLSAMSAEASAARDGLRLLARACAPLIERCYLLATQKRLLTRLAGFSTSTPSRRSMMEPPDASILIDPLRALVAALDRGVKGTKAGRGEYGECHADARRKDGISENSGKIIFREAIASLPLSQTPLVSLRAVGIAAVAARRLVRLAALRASRRITPTQGIACSPTRRAKQPGLSSFGVQASANDGDSDGDDVIPLGPRGVMRGVSMLCEADVPPFLPAAVLAGVASSIGGRPAAARCIGLLNSLVRCRGSSAAGGCRGKVWGEARSDEEPSLLRVLALGQARHWRRLEERGLVPARWLASWETGEGAILGGGHRAIPTARIVFGRLARHHGSEWAIWRRQVAIEESLRLLEATRRGTVELARCAEDSEKRLSESEERRLRAGTELETSFETSKVLRVELDKKCVLVSFLEERVHSLEKEVGGTVSSGAFASVEKALAESLAEVEKWRIRSASLEAALEEASDRKKKAARRARRGAQVVKSQEQAVRAQLQGELLSLRSYVLRSEQTVQELQEEARRQARETVRRGDPSLFATAETTGSSNSSSWIYLAPAGLS